MKSCPCGEKCPGGCPCPNYECQAPTLKTSVLVMNSYGGEWKPAVLLDSTGRNDEVPCFSPDEDTETYGSCSIMWRGSSYVFGGWEKEFQVSQLIGNQLQRVGELSFKHNMGACGNMADEQVYLCFGGNHDDKCWSADGPRGFFKQITNSKFEHYRTKISCSNSKSSKYHRLRLIKT